MKPYNISMNDVFNNIFNNLQFKIIESGVAHLDTSWDIKKISDDGRISFPYYTFYYIIDGEGIVETYKEPQQKIYLKPGNIYVIPPLLDVVFYCENKMTQLYFLVSIELEFVLWMLPSKVGVCEVSREYIEKIKDAYLCNNIRSVLFVRKCLVEDLFKCYDNDNFFDKKIELYSESIIKSILYIENNLSDQLNAAIVSAAIGISENSLRNKFKKEVGVSMKEFINRMVFSEAKRRLCTTKESIAEISDSLGFNDQFHFSHKFKSRFSESPLSYRKRSKNFI